MAIVYVFACGIVWDKAGAEDAGQELVRALACSDPDASLVAEVMLVEAGRRSIALLETAIASGILAPEQAHACLEELLRPAVAETVPSTQ